MTALAGRIAMLATLVAALAGPAAANGRDWEGGAMSEATKDDIIEALAGASYDEAVARLGQPNETATFTMTTGVSEFRIELRNIFSDEDLARDAPEILEATWSMDPETNLTLWFTRQGDVQRAVHHMRWTPGTDF